MDTNCGSGGGARHGGSRGGCTMVMNGSFGISQAPANNAGASAFIVPFNSGGPSLPIPAPAQQPEPSVTATVLLPEPVQKPAKPILPLIAAPETTTDEKPDDNEVPRVQPVSTSVPEPATGLLLLGGLLALAGIRKRRIH